MTPNKSLSPNQKTLLAVAAEREDGALDFQNPGDRRTARRSANALINRRLFREVRAKRSMPIWRDSDEGHSLALIITKAGRDALRALAEEPGEMPIPTSKRAPSEDAGEHRSPREGTKTASLFAMLSHETGATLQRVADATGWQPHTIRAAITGLRKRGWVVERQRGDDGAAIYRITELRLQLEI